VVLWWSARRCQVAAVATLGSVSIIASMWPCMPFRAAGSRWIFFRSGGSAEASALMMVRRPTWCLRSIARYGEGMCCFAAMTTRTAA